MLIFVVKTLREEFSLKKIASIMTQLLTAVAYLSTRNIMHRDIKLENILFDKDYNIKLSDFGCCVHSLAQRKTVCGTIEYLCPQMINSEIYGHEVDLYCLGVVMYELFYFDSPFYDREEEELYKNIREGVIIFDEKIRDVPESAKDLIMILLKSKSNPSAKELLQHPFFKEAKYEAN